MIKVLWITAAIGALILAGCYGQNPVGKPTVKVGKVRESGFLSDYTVLRPGAEGEASLVYWNLSTYKNIIVDPITVWLTPDSDLKDVPPKERQQLADAFHAAMVQELGTDFAIVDKSGPGTMWVRIALTNAAESNPALDTISTYVPQASVASLKYGHYGVGLTCNGRPCRWCADAPFPRWCSPTNNANN